MDFIPLISNAVIAVIAIIALTRIVPFLLETWRTRALINRLQKQGKVSTLWQAHAPAQLKSRLMADSDVVDNAPA